MRITNQVLSNNMLNNMYSSMWRKADIQNQMTTGKKVNKPSDDPSAMITSLRMRTKIQQNEQYTENATEVYLWLENTDEALSSVNSALQRTRELTVRASNGTNSDLDMTAIADELDQIIEEIGIVANAKVGDRYIFGGTNTKEKSYDVETGAWSGNSQKLNIEIGEGVVADMNLDGKALFGAN